MNNHSQIENQTIIQGKLIPSGKETLTAGYSGAIILPSINLSVAKKSIVPGSVRVFLKSTEDVAHKTHVCHKQLNTNTEVTA